MAFLTIKPTTLDKRISDEVASHTSPALEEAAEALTWGADEKILLGLAVAGWLYALRRRRFERVATHFLAVSLASAILPHVMKRAIDQTRPDRLTVRGHWRGVPFSGKSRDAFPSGHAVHMGALASASGLLSAPGSTMLRSLAIALSATRILLLAHWASDVVAGFALGALLERLMRRVTLRCPKGGKRWNISRVS